MIQTRWVRRKGTRQRPGVSLFTSLVAGFAILLAFVQMLVVNTSASCEFAAFWVTGWFDFASNFQLASVAVGALAFLFLTRIMARFERSAAAEAIMQGALIAALGAFMLALKAFIFPFGIPSGEQYAAMMNPIAPIRVPLIEEPRHTVAPWPFDYPPPPMQDLYASPWRDSSINKPMQEIFKSAQSPTWAEYKRMQQCVGDYRAAIAQYSKDKAAYIEWEEGFRQWTFAHPKEYEAQRKKLPARVIY